MFAEPEFWVAVGFVILMGVFAYVGIHRTVLTALDHRSERIKAELDDARRLKDEAAKLLAEYKARHASQCRGDGRDQHPVAIGQGTGGRRPAGQGHRGSSRQAELTGINSKHLTPVRCCRAGFFICPSPSEDDPAFH
jgi:ATP synthase B/B' CF(0)